MLPVISDFKEVAAVVREYLNTYCQIDLEKIVSVLAVRGADLSKPISATELNSINLSDTFVVYEIREDDSQDYFVFDEDDFTDTIITNVIVGNMVKKVYPELVLIIGRIEFQLEFLQIIHTKNVMKNFSVNPLTLRTCARA